MNETKKSDKFIELETEAKKAETLEELFVVWKRAHTLEVEEWENSKDGKKAGQQKPDTVPSAFLKTVPANLLDETMKKSFCGDGYIGTSRLAKEPRNNKNNANNELNKFNRFIVLKEENHIQEKEDWEQGISPYNTYYGDWAYNNEKALVKKVRDKKGEEKEKSTATNATKLGNILALIDEYEVTKKFEGKHCSKKDIQKLIRKSAIVNINKRGGIEESDYKDLVKYIAFYDEFFLKEIDLLRIQGSNLEFIVFGINEKYYKKIKELLEGKCEEWGVEVKLLNLMHPSRYSVQNIKKALKEE
jgi:hypothetical protein